MRPSVTQRIEILLMVKYGDRIRTQQDVTGSAVSKVETSYETLVMLMISQTKAS